MKILKDTLRELESLGKNLSDVPDLRDCDWPCSRQIYPDCLLRLRLSDIVRVLENRSVEFHGKSRRHCAHACNRVRLQLEWHQQFRALPHLTMMGTAASRAVFEAVGLTHKISSTGNHGCLAAQAICALTSKGNEFAATGLIGRAWPTRSENLKT